MIKDWDAWAKRIKQGQKKGLKRACNKLGVDYDRLLYKRVPTKKKGKAKRGKKQEPAPSGPTNIHEFACPVCWAVPESLRNDGKSIPRHLPIIDGVDLFRDTEFCNGQGKTARRVLDSGWKPGTVPAKTITATKFLKEKT